MGPTPRPAPVTVKAEGRPVPSDGPSTAIPPEQGEAPDCLGASPVPSGRGSQGIGRPADEDKSAPARPRSHKAKVDRLLELAEAEESRRLVKVEAERMLAEQQRAVYAAQMSAFRRSLASPALYEAQADFERGRSAEAEILAIDVRRPWWRFWR